MFSKLLKYDIRAVFKYWWIAAATSVFLAFFGGGCLRTIVSVEGELTAFHTFSILGLILSFVGLCIFVTLTEILVLVRFYKNFFSDEGYLTFTLPVRKTSLLNSKIVSAFIMTGASFFVFVADIIVLITVGAGEKIFTPEFFEGIGRFFYEMFREDALFSIILILELLGIFFVGFLIQTLGIFICITFAAVIAKKHKVLAAIGIYYVASGAVGFITQLLFIPNLFLISPSGEIPLVRVMDMIYALPETLGMITTLIAVLGLLAVSVLVFGVMWLLEYYLLDRKLNLE